MKQVNQPTKLQTILVSISPRNIGIRAKIVVPYFLLTLVIASVGIYVLTNFIATSLQDRINNQLVDAGRIVSEGVVQYEEERLQTLRTVAGTLGVAEAVVANDSDSLAALVPQIIANSNSHAVELINMDSMEVYGWQQPNSPENAPLERTGTDLSPVADVQWVLGGNTDALGDKRTFLSETPEGLMLFTVGPLILDGNQVGAVMIGTDLRLMTFDLTLNAVARVSFYDRQGKILQTTLGGGQETFMESYQESPERYSQVVSQLQSVPVIVESPEIETPLRELDVLGQSYQLAFGDWRLRGQSFGMFSVALPRNFLVTTVINGGNLFFILFSFAIAVVFFSGVLLSRLITQPIYKLVNTATAVTEGNLDQRSGIDNKDEIGTLAVAFDTMTETLAQRNRQLLEKASELEAIVDSIADGVIVMNTQNEIVTLNPAAQRLLSDMSHDFSLGSMRELSAAFTIGSGELEDTPLPTMIANQKPKQYQVGNRILGAMAAPVKTPNGERIGSVVVLRDITREVEADNLKDAFITSISHELRTPLTLIKVYADLMKSTANGHLDKQQLTFIQNISKGSQDLEHHINQLINISEIQAGTLNISKRVINFVDLATEIGEAWREKLAEKDLLLEIITPDISLEIEADAAHLSWALNNLLSNAHDYTSDGGRIKLFVFQQGNDASIAVIDDGMGIATADQPHLFDRFFRAHNVDNYESRGVGLGLFISKSIAELHGGTITVESESGVGSTFTLSIPLAEIFEYEPA